MKHAIATELHKQARRNFPTRRVELKGIDDLLQADLCEMIPYAKVNRGFKYILTIINCFSKYAYAIPLKTKTAKEVCKALTPILEKNKTRHFHTDAGCEFFNGKIRGLFKKYGINHYSTFSEKKASIVERFNRTLKTMMWREFTAQGTYKWLELLPKLVTKYNNTKHRTIGMKPKDVNKRNERQVLMAINKSTYRTNIKQPKFKVGDKVRISRYKKTFTKGYQQNWSNEIFTVHTVLPSSPPTYRLTDIRGEIIQGTFYEHEMNKTKYNNVYLVEKIVGRKGDKVRVRWLGFDASHDSWVHKRDIL